jgi:twinkle protein
MGVIVDRNLPCLNVSCGSSDARQLYEDGTSFCFSCQTWFNVDGSTRKGAIRVSERITPINRNELKEIELLPSRGFRERNITKPVAEFYGVKVAYGDDGKISTHYYPYGSNSYNVRKLPKEFRWINRQSTLFGMNKFSGSGKRVVITEGEIDAMTVAQMWMDKYGKIYPVVAIPGVSGMKALVENREWIRGYDEIILSFDEDEAGQEAVKKAVHILGADKTRVTKLPMKDANATYLELGWKELYSCILDAALYIPKGIMGKEELWTALVDLHNTPSIPYPPCLEGLNEKLKGMRMNEISMFIAGTSIGKSTIMREIELHVLDTTNDKVGVISLEESPPETARKLAGMVLYRNPASEEIPLEDLKVGFDKVFNDDRIIMLDHQGSFNDVSIIDKMEYMCLNGCRFIIIDHITILASEGLENLTGNEAQDAMMANLLRLAKKHPVWIGIVSHLRKASGGGRSFEEGRFPSLDDAKGSGSLKQISFDVIAFARNLYAEDLRERNTTRIRVNKCRHTGLTGEVCGIEYNFQTGRLVASDLFVEEPTIIVPQSKLVKKVVQVSE